jgi:asparagine synthase (glutamine-hydrolysing)
MSSTEAPLCTGLPRFDDADLQRIAVQHGLPMAWAQSLAKGPREAMAGISGDFAIGLREPSGRTFLAVDRFGVRTLCYRIDGGVLRFAERADLLADPGHEIDSQAIYDYLYFHVIPSPRTIFKRVFRLPPGHYALFENGRLTVAPYWTPEFVEDRSANFNALREEFRRLLRDAVARQLDGSKPACFLSGGTDSSTVAGMIREACGQAAATYSIGFEAEGYDEMEYARIAARHFGTEHHEYYVTPADLVRSIPEVAAHYDQPFGNSSALPAYYCAKMARDDGVARILAGDGGDELFGGNTRYATQRIFGLYDAIPRALREGMMEPVFRMRAVGRTPLLRKGSRYIEQAKVPMPERLQTYNLLEGLGTADMLTADFLSQVDTHSPARQQREVWALANADGLVNRMLAFDWRYTLAECDLPKVRETTRLAGIEVGFPFLDGALLDFSLRLRADHKLKGLRLRWFFKEALRGFLPDAIIAKKKKGFGLPFGVWLVRDMALKRLASNSLASLSTRCIVRPEFVCTLLEQRLSEHPGYYGEMVWILMMMEQWLQRHAPGYRLSV